MKKEDFLKEVETEAMKYAIENCNLDKHRITNFVKGAIYQAMLDYNKIHENEKKIEESKNKFFYKVTMSNEEVRIYYVENIYQTLQDSEDDIISIEIIDNIIIS